MNTKTMINIKTDKNMKLKAQKIAKELGLPLSTLINSYLRQFIRDKSVNFSVGYKMTPKLEKLLSSIEKDIEEGKNLVGPFDSTKKMDEYLDAL